MNKPYGFISFTTSDASGCLPLTICMNPIPYHLFHPVASVDKMSDINVIYRLSLVVHNQFFCIVFTHSCTR